MSTRTVPDRTSLTRALPIALVVALLAAGAVTERFFSIDNARAILATASVVGITAIGATLVMIAGSVVSLAASQTASATAMTFLALLEHGLATAVGVALLVGMVVTGLQGAVVGYWGANPIVLTIAAGFAITGAATWVGDGANIYASAPTFQVLNATPLGIPLGVYVLVAVTALATVVLRGTTVGRQMYLVGENRDAARAAGLPVGRIVVGAWVFFGLCLGLAGIFLGAFNTTADTTTGGNLSLDAVAAVLVGGTAISGGRGSAVRTLGAALLIVTISDLLLLRGFDTGEQILVKGLLVLVVVLVVHLQHRSRETR